VSANLLLRRTEPLSTRGPSTAGDLPADVLAAYTRRLIVAMLVTAGIFVVTASMYLTVLSEFGSPMSKALALVVIVVSGGLSLVLWRGVSTQRQVELIGAGYELFVVFILAFMEYSRIPVHEHTVPLDTVSWSCVGIVFFPFLVPMNARKTLVVALTAASLHPVALWVAAASLQIEVPSNEVVTSYFMPQYICAFVAAIPAHVLYHLGGAVKQARRLGSYELIEELGKGGMGEVWRARHRLLARPAAIKLIRPEVLDARDDATRTTFLERFEREAQATAALESPHTVELYDFGVASDGTLFYVMELLSGLDFESLVKRHGPLPPARVVYLLRQVCESLYEAHERGLVHRDIKPANLMVGRRGRHLDFVRVLDFGLVKHQDMLVEEDAAKLTADGVVTGTPAYLPPEALSGSHPIGSGSDLYSLGCVAYWLLTGRLVFEADSPMKIAFAHATEDPTPPSEVSEVPIPPALDHIVMQLLAKSPDDRPASALELLTALESCSEVEAWTPEAAEKWWGLHAPEVVQPAPVADHGG
jgi:serine/threonine-protein kinase